MIFHQSISLEWSTELGKKSVSTPPICARGMQLFNEVNTKLPYAALMVTVLVQGFTGKFSSLRIRDTFFYIWPSHLLSRIGRRGASKVIGKFVRVNLGSSEDNLITDRGCGVY